MRCCTCCKKSVCQRLIALVLILAGLATVAGCHSEPREHPQTPQTAGAAAINTTDAGLARLEWLSGRWVSRDTSNVTIEEYWMDPVGDMMLGVSRTHRDGAVLGFEFLRILRDRDQGEIIYLASPNGRTPPTEFRMIETGDRYVAFANPEHDFPQRIEYRQQEDGTLIAMIEGMSDGKLQTLRWTYRPARP